MTDDQLNSSTWWQEKDSKKASELVFAHIKFLNRHQGYRHTDNLRYLRLYSNFEVLGLSAGEYARPAQQSSFRRLPHLTLNIIQAMCDTVTSKISKNKPKPMFLTSGGEWSLRRKAQKLNKFAEGQFEATNFYAKSAQAFLDSCIFGTGAVKIFADGPDIKAERVFIDEIIVDDAEGIYGEPRQMHQRKYIHREVLMGMYPEHEGAIQMASRSKNTFSPASERSDMICVVESWHRSSGKKNDNGRHMISIESGNLLDEEYTKDYFPFVFWRWGLRPLGFFGQGLGEQLQGLQLEINKLLKTIQISMHLTAIPKVFVEASSKVVSSHLDNSIGGLINYVGVKPSYESVGATAPELFSHLDRLYQRSFEVAGVSQLSAQSVKPSGLDSGKALREFNDIETERFMSIGQRYEEVFMDAAKIMIDIARELYADDQEYSVNVKGDKFLDTIKWKDIDLEEDQYMMQVFPTSSLSSTPAGRLQDVQEMLAANLIDPEAGKKLLQFPDLESVMNLETASLNNLDKMIELMVEKTQYNPPEPFQNLSLGIQKMQEAYLFHKTEGAPESVLDLMRRWIEDANSMLQAAAQPPEPPLAPPIPEEEVVTDEVIQENLDQEQLAAAEAASLPPEGGEIV